MPKDALTYSLLASELNSILANGRISKITMPLPDTILLSIRAGGKNHLLLLSSNASTPRVHLTSASLPSPQVAPAFLMHLRKHIGGGSIEGVYQTPYERIIAIKIKAHNELMIAEQKSLIVEIMGKHSNIILVNENGLISDSIKHITLDISAKRQVLPSLPYLTAPAQSDKINLSETEALKKRLRNFEGGNLEKYLLSNLSGLSIDTIREVLHRAFVKSPSNKLDDTQIGAILKEFADFTDLNTARPCALSPTFNKNKLVDFYIRPYYSAIDQPLKAAQDINKTVIKSPSCSIVEPPSSKTESPSSKTESPSFIVESPSSTIESPSSTIESPSSIEKDSFIYFDTLNEAMDAYYSLKSSDQINSDRRNLLLSVIKAAIAKSQKRLGTHLQKQQDAIDFENDKKLGDLILSNLYRIRKGDSEIEVEDYYDDNNKLRIKIDPHKTPQANAQIFYKSYNKKKTALSKLEVFISELYESIDYLESLAYFSESLDSEEQYNEILDELSRLGFLRRKLQKRKEEKKTQQFLITEYNGYRILIGRSSIGNDALVRRAKEEFVWLHASSIHGSHVIIENFSLDYPPSDVLLHAASLAAFYSKASQSENVPVDYTFIKNVKKPRGAAPGKVVFSSQKTLYVSPQMLLDK